MTTAIQSPAELLDLVGRPLGPSDWLDIPQQDVDLFADATHDHQWIHVEGEQARGGPFGGPIAHGYLTLSLLIPLWFSLLRLDGPGMTVNYGLNRVRFPAPVPVGSRVRLRATVVGAEEVGSGRAVQVLIDATVEMDGGDKPACVAQMVLRYSA